MTENLTYANGRADVALEGRSSQKIRLRIVALGTQPASWTKVHWSPEDRGVHDLELSARITGARGTIGATIRVLYNLEFGAADLEYNEPRTAPPIGAGIPITPYVMPERGMKLRLNARRMSIGFRCELVGGAATTIELSAAIQPSSTGPDAPRVPYATSAFAAERVALPMFAREWRLRDLLTGNAFAAGTLGWTNTFGAAGPPITLASLADWSPVPQSAVTYIATAAHIAEFR